MKTKLVKLLGSEATNASTEQDHMTSLPPGPSTATHQPDLFDHGQHAKRTRAIAAAAAIEKGPSRREQIESFVRSRGQSGATRHEIADHHGWPVQSVCGPVLALLRNGRLIENGQTRPTQYGSPAAVIIANPAIVEG